MLSEEVRRALDISGSSSPDDRTIDITTTGRKSGQARRIEIWFYRQADDLYLSGYPTGRARDWLVNLEADPHFTFHLKHRVRADLPATAEIITDPAERRRVLGDFVADFNSRRETGSDWPSGDLDDWVASSPLARIVFDDA